MKKIILSAVLSLAALANSSDVYSRGFDEFIYPSNRTFMFGLNVTF